MSPDSNKRLPKIVKISFQTSRTSAERSVATFPVCQLVFSHLVAMVGDSRSFELAG